MELNVTVALNWAVNKEHVILMYNQFGIWISSSSASSPRACLTP